MVCYKCTDLMCSVVCRVYVLYVLCSQLTFSFSPVQDDMQIRVFNYNTLERVHMFEAHSDYIRCIAVHPTQPYILTSSGTILNLLYFVWHHCLQDSSDLSSTFVLKCMHFFLCVCTYALVCFFFYADDMLIKLWDWEKKWSCSQVFEGHTHYVMQIVINPKDNNQFASASLDRTIKVEASHCCCFYFILLMVEYCRTPKLYCSTKASVMIVE